MLQDKGPDASANNKNLDGASFSRGRDEDRLTLAKTEVTQFLDAIAGLPHFDIGIASNPEKGLHIRVRFYGPKPEGVDLPADMNGVPIVYGQNQRPASKR